MKLIKVFKSKKDNIYCVAIVDDEDFDIVAASNWSLHSHGYARRSGKRTTSSNYMHRVITNCPDGMDVHHINGNKLDNRRCNLLVCTHQQNMQVGTNKRVKRKYDLPRGVRLKRNRKKQYQGRVKHNGKEYTTRHFLTPEEADKAVILLRKKLGFFLA